MPKKQYLIQDSNQLTQLVEDIKVGMRDNGKVKVEWAPMVSRSLSQNALFHLWCGEIASAFSRRSKKDISKHEIKIILKHKFLGYTNQGEPNPEDEGLIVKVARAIFVEIKDVIKKVKAMGYKGFLQAVRDLGDKAKIALGEGELIGKTWIPPQLRSTTSLDKPEFFHFMTQVEQWAAENGVIVSNPAESEFVKLKESQHDI